MSRNVRIQLTFFYPLSSCCSVSPWQCWKIMFFKVQNPMVNFDPNPIQDLTKSPPSCSSFCTESMQLVRSLLYVSYHMLTGLKNQDAQCPPQRHNFVVHNFHRPTYMQRYISGSLLSLHFLSSSFFTC